MPGGTLGTYFWVAAVLPVSIPVCGMVGQNLIFRADHAVVIFIIDISPPGVSALHRHGPFVGCGQTKVKVERTVQFVRDNFMVGIKYNSLADLNGQALAWCNKVNGKVHATSNEIPFERLKKEGLNPLTRKYIIDKINLRRVQKDCFISYV